MASGVKSGCRIPFFQFGQYIAHANRLCSSETLTAVSQRRESYHTRSNPFGYENQPLGITVHPADHFLIMLMTAFRRTGRFRFTCLDFVLYPMGISRVLQETRGFLRVIQVPEVYCGANPVLLCFVEHSFVTFLWREAPLSSDLKSMVSDRVGNATTIPYPFLTHYKSPIKGVLRGRAFKDFRFVNISASVVLYAVILTSRSPDRRWSLKGMRRTPALAEDRILFSFLISERPHTMSVTLLKNEHFSPNGTASNSVPINVPVW